MSDHHHGYAKNGKVCSCGYHHGCGDFTPEQRATMAAFARDKFPEYMSSTQISFLSDWERSHGIVKYRMDVVGKSTGEYNRASKGQDIIGPVYLDPKDFIKTDDMFSPRKRADIHG